MSSVFFWITGWKWLLNHPRYLGLVLAPLLIGLILVGIGLNLGYPWVNFLSQWVIQQMPDFIVALGGKYILNLTWFVLLVVFLSVGFIVFYGIYLVVCAPFYSLLAEKVLKKSEHFEPSGFSFRMFMTSIIKALCFLILAIMAFLISFVPGFQWVGPMTAAGILAFDCLDYSFEARQMGLRQRFRFVMQQKRIFLGLSGGMALTLLVPGLTFLALPGAVVGAALIISKGQQ
jgi:CysZ protein